VETPSGASGQPLAEILDHGAAPARPETSRRRPPAN
jgi:hypothetical protein